MDGLEEKTEVVIEFTGKKFAAQAVNVRGLNSRKELPEFWLVDDDEEMNLRMIEGKLILSRDGDKEDVSDKGRWGEVYEKLSGIFERF